MNSKPYNMDITSQSPLSSMLDSTIASSSFNEEDGKAAMDFDLFILHDGALKPMLSSNVKSGVYRLWESKDDSAQQGALDNVYVTRAKYGTVLPAKVFEETNHSFRQANQLGEHDDLMEQTHTQNGKKNRLESYVKGIRVFKIISPADLDLELSSLSKTVQATNESSDRSRSAISVTLPPKTTRGRPRKDQRKPRTTNDQKPSNNFKIVLARTRCGRLSFAPRHIPVTENQTQNGAESLTLKQNGANINAESIHNEMNLEKDSKEERVDPGNSLDFGKRERKISKESYCKICNKIILGKMRMLKHLELCKTRNKTEDLQPFQNQESLYDFFTTKMLHSGMSEHEKIEKFLDELSNFVSQLQTRSSDIVQSSPKLYFINSKVANILGVNEGHFGINIDAVRRPANLRENVDSNSLTQLPPPRLDYNLSLSLDDTLNDAKLSLPDNMITSDDSLLKTVDDLVKEKMKDLSAVSNILSAVDQVPSVMHYEHANDNAVEACTIKENQHPPLLDLSLDLFQFNSN